MIGAIYVALAVFDWIYDKVTEIAGYLSEFCSKIKEAIVNVVN